MTAVKYCGGCNPRYDRKEARRLLELQTGDKMEYAEPGKRYELLYVICGCSSACVNLSSYEAERTVIITEMPVV